MVDCTNGSSNTRIPSLVCDPVKKIQGEFGVVFDRQRTGGCGQSWRYFDQLAAVLEHETVESGAFRTKVTTAGVFGLVEIEGDRVSLTDLGNEADRKQNAAPRLRDSSCVCPCIKPYTKNIKVDYRRATLRVKPKWKRSVCSKTKRASTARFSTLR